MLNEKHMVSPSLFVEFSSSTQLACDGAITKAKSWDFARKLGIANNPNRARAFKNSMNHGLPSRLREGTISGMRAVFFF